jgi:hypothetical protein
MFRSFKAIGGTQSIYNQYTIHKFISNGTFKIIGYGSKKLEYLIVGGGGLTSAGQYNPTGNGCGSGIVIIRYINYLS